MRNFAVVFASICGVALLMTSCQKDENFSVGWDEALITTDITLDPTTDSEIILGTINPHEIVDDYLAANYPDANWYEIEEAVTMSGNVVEINVLPLADIESFNLYARQGGREILVGEMVDDPDQTASFSLEGFGHDLAEFSDGSDVEIVLRTDFVEDPQLTEINVQVKFFGRFVVNGNR